MHQCVLYIFHLACFSTSLSTRQAKMETGEGIYQDLSLPREVWCLIMWFASYKLLPLVRRAKQPDNPKPILHSQFMINELCKFGCVSYEWKGAADSLLLLRFQSEMCSNDKNLTKFAHITRVEKLHIHNPIITQASLRHVTSLTSLQLSTQAHLSPETINVLTNLRVLRIRGEINDDICALTKLEKLSLGSTAIVTYEGISCLTNLKSLVMYGNGVNAHGILPLVNLKVLRLSDNLKITDIHLSELTALTSLRLARCDNIVSRGLYPLTNLRVLELEGNSKITNKALSFLTNLEKLSIFPKTKISDLGISNLTNLRTLHLSRGFTPKATCKLTGLTYLYYEGCPRIRHYDLLHLKNLEYLIIQNPTITSNLLTSLSNLKIFKNVNIEADFVEGLMDMIARKEKYK